MANSQNGITRANALAIAAELAHGAGRRDVAEVLEKMHEQLTKPRKATVSKARKLNEGLATKVRDAISANGSPVDSKWIVANVSDIASTQKAAAVCRVAIELGLINKLVNGKAITYEVA